MDVPQTTQALHWKGHLGIITNTSSVHYGCVPNHTGFSRFRMASHFPRIYFFFFAVQFIFPPKNTKRHRSNLSVKDSVSVFFQSSYAHLTLHRHTLRYRLSIYLSIYLYVYMYICLYVYMYIYIVGFFILMSVIRDLGTSPTRRKHVHRSRQ